MKKERFLYAIFFSAIMLQSIVLFAQEEEEEGPEPPPAAPINKYVLIMGLMGIVYAWHIINKKRKSATLKSDTGEV